jgi:dethiobiotin synthetase
VGTGTEVGKTWVSARLLAALRDAGHRVSARKPAQSFDPADDPSATDAAVLGRSAGEAPEAVCPRHRWYEVAMAPPMAAAALGKPGFTVADLVAELRWPAWAGDAGGAPSVGLVETAGGVRSPLADDGDSADLARALDPDAVVLVADAGLGTINGVRLSVDAVAGVALTVVVLNRFEPDDDLHQRNRDWLARRDGLHVVTLPGGEADLCRAVLG